MRYAMLLTVFLGFGCAKQNNSGLAEKSDASLFDNETYRLRSAKAFFKSSGVALDLTDRYEPGFKELSLDTFYQVPTRDQTDEVLSYLLPQSTQITRILASSKNTSINLIVRFSNGEANANTILMQKLFANSTIEGPRRGIYSAFDVKFTENNTPEVFINILYLDPTKRELDKAHEHIGSVVAKLESIVKVADRNVELWTKSSGQNGIQTSSEQGPAAPSFQGLTYRYSNSGGYYLTSSNNRLGLSGGLSFDESIEADSFQSKLEFIAKITGSQDLLKSVNRATDVDSLRIILDSDDPRLSISGKVLYIPNTLPAEEMLEAITANVGSKPE